MKTRIAALITGVMVRAVIAACARRGTMEPTAWTGRAKSVRIGETMTMGEIRASVTLENRDDRAVVDRGYGVEADVRRTTVEGIVLEALDLIADCRSRTLAPRHPEGPLLALC